MTRRFLFAALPLALTIAAARAAITTSYNTGSLGPAANGTNADGVTFTTGAVSAGGDQTAVYNGTANVNTSITTFQSGLNPASNQPFTLEFWANPTASDNDDSPVSNRVSAGNRSGWVFFQRAAGTGWNFRMYNGVGSGLGWDLTGGTSNLNSWSHVVATWDGSAALLYVNGFLADNTNDPAATGVYNASTNATFFAASTDSGSPYAGSVDEIAFYPTALSAASILTHFNTAGSATPGTYHALVLADGARLQLSNNVPEPSSLALLGLGALALRRRRS